jgi:hypothetical protein
MLNLARHGRDDVPDASVQRRVERSLGRRIALGTALTAGGTLIAKTAAGARVWMLVAKIVGVTGAATLVGAGWYATRGGDTEPAGDQQPPLTAAQVKKRTLGGGKAEAKSDASPPPVAPSPQLPADPEPARSLRGLKKTPLEAAAPITEAPAVAAFPSSEPDRLLAETTDLRRAQQALRSGDPALALRLVREQDELHAGGALQQERAAVSIFALCESGQVAKARSEAARFEGRWPESALVARVRASCRDR